MPTEATPPHLRPLDPRVRVLWWLSLGLTALGATVVATLAAVVVPALMPWLPLTVLVVGTAGAVGVPLLRYRRWRYALAGTHLEIRHGVLWTTVSVIPYARLQFVDTKQGPLDRRLGLATLVVHTAAVGTSGTLPGLDLDTAAALRARLGEVDAELPSDDIPV